MKGGTDPGLRAILPIKNAAASLRHTWKDSSERRCCASAGAIARNVSAASGTECLSSIRPNRIWLTSWPLHEFRFVCSSSRAAATSAGERCFWRAKDTTTFAMCLDGSRPLARMGPA